MYCPNCGKEDRIMVVGGTTGRIQDLRCRHCNVRFIITNFAAVFPESRNSIKWSSQEIPSDPVDPVTGMRVWQVWSEGWAANEGWTPATFCGEYPGETFADACETYVNTKVRPEERFNFDKKKNTFWGCRYFDNEHDARKSFG